MEELREKTAINFKAVGKGMSKVISKMKAGSNVNTALRRSRRGLRQARKLTRTSAVGATEALNIAKGSQAELLSINRELLKKNPKLWNVPGRIRQHRQLSKVQKALATSGDIIKSVPVNAKGEVIAKGVRSKIPGKKVLILGGVGAGLYGAGAISGAQGQRARRKYNQ